MPQTERLIKDYFLEQSFVIAIMSTKRFLQ